MKARSRLKHSAAGLLGFLLSRNNDVNGYWGPGLLYRDVATPPCTIKLNLLTGASLPESNSARLMAAVCATFLQKALSKQGFSWHDVTLASITFQFNAQVADPNFYFPCAGNPFICTVSLATIQGQHVVAHANGRCFPHQAFQFAQSTRATVCDNL